MSNQILHSRIRERFTDIFETPPDVPNYLNDNMSHDLREYQVEALRNFIYTQEASTADISFNHLLFHMATGSGKTLVLAATILYLYKEQNHKNFIFFVNSDAIIKKTYDNLMNTESPKYLFSKEGIEIEGEQISIQVVDTFPMTPAENTIYLKLTTIQKLHMDLGNPRENGLTYESLEESKVVLLADEAHHINVLTRNTQRNLNAKEALENTWEYTVNRLLRLNPENRLIEFTATIDLTQNALFEKYHDKIVYQYDLKRFMEDGYSKNVVLLRANEEDQHKMMNALLLSQYRKYVAKDNGIDLKPIILFKSNKIAISKASNSEFLEMVSGLTVSVLKETIERGLAVHKNSHSIWHKMFEYYSKKDLVRVIQDLQWDFVEETTLNANSAEFLSETNALLLNTLEENDNPIRTIFAVAKLNEGWDVLNLFDIVRISEGASAAKSTTDSEAQLIGRGARYYPFVYEGEHSYTRRFDILPSDLKAIETLHYHTINENQYIKNLNKSLKSANIQVKEDQYNRLQAKLKPSVRKADWFKNGKIYINQAIPTTPDDYQSLQDYNILPNYEVDYEHAIEQDFGTNQETSSGTQRHTEMLKITKHLLQKAIQRNKFYRFNNLKEYVPGLCSMQEFIESHRFLGQLSIHVSLPIDLSVNQLPPVQHLRIVERFLSYAEKNIRNNYMKVRGTPIFEGVAFPELIDDYLVEISRVTHMSQVIQERNMRNEDWFIYDKAIVNGLESDLIDFIQGYIDRLREEYGEVYLIRNERKVKIIEINGTRGFMPDFLLYMKNEEATYQVFLEPKGGNLLKQDQWKEAFLQSLSERTDIEVLSENKKVRLLGIKFYNHDPQLKSEFRQDFENKLLGLEQTTLFGIGTPSDHYSK